MFRRKDEPTPLLTPDELARQVAEGRAPVLVDVRSHEDFAKGHLPGAISIPLSELERRATELNPEIPITFY